MLRVHAARLPPNTKSATSPITARAPIPPTALATTPPGLLDKYKIELPQEVLANVTVIGPPEKIDALKKGTLTAKARLEITPADLNKPMQRRKVKYDLPDGVSVSKEDFDKEIPFRLTDRATASE